MGPKSYYEYLLGKTMDELATTKAGKELILAAAQLDGYLVGELLYRSSFCSSFSPSSGVTGGLTIPSSAGDPTPSFSG
jgi:hypothetical protein